MNDFKTNADHPYISLVIPAYNEEKRIEESLIKIVKYINRIPYSVELFVVNDGSTDRTITIAKESLDGLPNYKILNYDKNRGKGYAVKKGVLESKGRYVLFSDADLSTPIEELDKFVKTLEQGYDIVIGTRKGKHAKVKKRQPLYREYMGKVFTLITNILLVQNVSDITCGFKAFKKEVGKALFQNQLIYNWSFDAEILFLAQKFGYKIKEIPVTWYDAEGTKVKLSRDIFGSLKGIFQIRFNFLCRKYKIN